MLLFQITLEQNDSTKIVTAFHTVARNLLEKNEEDIQRLLSEKNFKGMKYFESNYTVGKFSNNFKCEDLHMSRSTQFGVRILEQPVIYRNWLENFCFRLKSSSTIRFKFLAKIRNFKIIFSFHTK